MCVELSASDLRKFEREAVEADALGLPACASDPTDASVLVDVWVDSIVWLIGG